MSDAAFLTMQRKNGTVEVVSTDAGWFITGRGKASTLRMRIPRCTRCAARYRKLCTVVHRGYPADHERKHCHGGHVERVRKLIDAVARTYGPAVK